jgi:large subunit ribosomal protein L18
MAVSLSTRKQTASRTAARRRRQLRGRKTIFGSPDRPRLAVTRSSKHITAQVVDDSRGHTLASASSMEGSIRHAGPAAGADKTELAKRVGQLVAERAQAAGVHTVVFDRAGNKYHGRIAALADSARGGGLGF